MLFTDRQEISKVGCNILHNIITGCSLWVAMDVLLPIGILLITIQFQSSLRLSSLLITYYVIFNLVPYNP